MIRVENHLIVPFGRASCESHRIRLVGSSTQEMLFESESPCLYINRSNFTGVTLEQFGIISPSTSHSLLADDPLQYLHSLCDLLRTDCELQTCYEHLFLTLYFDLLWEAHGAFDARLARSLVPLPQTHLYLTDFSNLIAGKCEQKCVKVDFAFWTGQRFLAVQIDPSRDDRTQDGRLLRLWGIELIRLAGDEIGPAALKKFVGGNSRDGRILNQQPAIAAPSKNLP